MNGLLMFFASYSKYKKLSIITIALWVFFMLSRANLSLGYIFPLTNILTFVLVSNLSRFFKKSMSNKVYSIFSILIWSIFIDLACYFLFPNMLFGQSIFTYIFNGIVFNFRFVVYNVCYLIGIKALEKLFKEVKSMKKSIRMRGSVSLEI